MARILAGEVQAAFARTGLRPVLNSLLTLDGLGCDGLAVLVIDECSLRPQQAPDAIIDAIVHRAIRGLRRFSEAYRVGFANGWDGRSRFSERKDYLAGYADGVAAAALMFSQQPKEEPALAGQ